MARLAKNQTLTTLDGRSLRVLDKIGEGGQGIVYKVKCGKKTFALKWYKSACSDAFYDNLKKNAKAGSPADTFLWPLSITEKAPDGSFGYVMKLCPQAYKPFSEFLLAHVQFESLNAWINAGIQLTASFRILHNKGYSYPDLNDGNFFFDPKTGNVRICDNDNVAPNGINLGILGKPRYVAPELVNSVRRPDMYSDRFSLAVILFLLFFRGHPLEGKRDNCDKPNNELNLFCNKPVFVYDPKDLSNRPKPQVHKNVEILWGIFPSFVRKQFIKAFDKNLMKNTGLGRENRIMEKEWLQMFKKLRQSVITCPRCKKETFFNMKKDSYKCMECGVKIVKPVSLVIGKDIIPLQPNRKLYGYEIDSNQELTILSGCQQVGEVITNPKKPKIWGLRNTSNASWSRITPGGKENVCEPDGVVTIIRGITIKFGTNGEGVIA